MQDPITEPLPAELKREPPPEKEAHPGDRVTFSTEGTKIFKLIIPNHDSLFVDMYAHTTCIEADVSKINPVRLTINPKVEISEGEDIKRYYILFDINDNTYFDIPNGSPPKIVVTP
jgi:hypothetical protein